MRIISSADYSISLCQSEIKPINALLDEVQAKGETVNDRDDFVDYCRGPISVQVLVGGEEYHISPTALDAEAVYDTDALTHRDGRITEIAYTPLFLEVLRHDNDGIYMLSDTLRAEHKELMQRVESNVRWAETCGYVDRGAYLSLADEQQQRALKIEGYHLLFADGHTIPLIYTTEKIYQAMRTHGKPTKIVM